MSNSAFLMNLKTLWYLTARRERGSSQAERLEDFYSGQALWYDSFRAKMLHGRDALFENLPVSEGTTWVDLGAGTGENVERFELRLHQLRQVWLVDLAPSLLRMAEGRIRRHGWSQITTVCDDVTHFTPSEPADIVTLSYSLSMIPDWIQTVENAWSMLKPGGYLGVVDFYVSRKHPPEGLRRHRWVTRSLWPLWFACDNVFLNSDHLPLLRSRFETILLEERSGSLPFIPLLKVPHYVFIGRKPE